MVSVESRIRRMEKNPSPKRLKVNVVTTDKLGFRAVTTKTVAPDAITPNEAAFGTTVVSATQPTEYLKEGTTWVNPDDGATNVYSTALDDFVPVTDATAQLTADGKNTIYAQTTAPSGASLKTNDIWYDTDDGNKLYVWSGTAWTNIQDTAISAAADAAQAAKNTADGKNKIYRQDYEPTGGTYALGDIWFDTDDSNKMYRYSVLTTATVTNKALASNVVTLTVSAAHSFVVGETITVSGVDATFNGSYTVTATPTALTVKYAKTATNVTSVSSSGTITNTAGWKGFALGDGALLSISASKLTAGTIDASVITVSNLDAGQITAGYISAARIQANTLDVNVLTAGTLRSGTIYTGDIVASQITSGTITGRTIRTATSGRRVEVDATNNALSFYNAAGDALGHIRPGADYAGIIISSGGTATSNFIDATHPKMLMYPIGTDGQFSLILNNGTAGFFISSAGGVQTATLGPTNTTTLGVPFSLREMGFAQASVFPDLSAINTISGTEGQIVLTYS